MSVETDTQAAEVGHSSGITPMSLQKTLTEKLEAQHVAIEDISGKIPTIRAKVIYLHERQVDAVKLSKPS